jgi:16S rRNA (cytosine1402-N4)-methyltransferase
MDAAREHTPVLYKEVLDGLQPRSDGTYIDATVGGGGHAWGILQESAPGGRLLGLDADPDAIEYAQELLASYQARVVLREANFRNLKDTAQSVGFDQVDGILMDLGISSRQLRNGSRGFSFAAEGPLDMRLGPGQRVRAADLVNGSSESELAELLWRYGEERQARRIARAIVRARPLSTTTQLADLIARTVAHSKRIHPATRTFQALRIAVNDELGALEAALSQTRDLLRPGGRLAVISFHSLEDRLVKRFIRLESRECVCPPEIPVCICSHRPSLRSLTAKPIRPSDAEIERNRRSRSARLRLAERLNPAPAGDGVEGLLRA